MTNEDTIRAPWTPQQVKALNEYQESGAFHPYTCVNSHEPLGRELVATEAGWVCRHCSYTQNWAHAFNVGLAGDGNKD